ncbi:MAG TPA: substrate-binding domain-containing protein, partial [Opitutaceae bacterium]|nr:substrate-binding domain-containing protein [Opitutaceae bacterium]
EANDSPQVGDRWFGAYLMQQLQYPADDRLPLCPGTPTDQESFGEWFRNYEPDALLVTHSNPVRQWLAMIGRKVPRDLGMVELQDNAGQTGSGVCYDPAKIGSVAVEMLIGLMCQNEKGIPKDHHEVTLSGKWQEGTTLPHRQPVSQSRARRADRN